MSLSALLSQLALELSKQKFGHSYLNENGDLVDSGVQKPFSLMIDTINNTKTIRINETIDIENNTGGPIFRLRNNPLANGVSSSDLLIEGTRTDTNENVKIGFGLASENIVANEFIPLVTAAADPEEVNARFGIPGGYPTSTLPYAMLMSQHRPAAGGMMPSVGMAYVTAINDDTLTCTAPGGATVVVAKPPELRDGATADPPYTTSAPDNVIWITAPVNKTDIEKVRFIDLNVDARRVDDGGGGGGGVFAATITAINDDTLTVTLPDSSSVAVAKPPVLRKTGNTTGYTYTNSQQRTVDATGDEEYVTPAYSNGETIWVASVPGGTGVTDVDYIDLNSNARSWALECDE